MPFQSWAPGVTHVVAAPASWQARAHAAAGRDVVCPAWLEACGKSGVLAPLRPPDYCHMRGDTAAAAVAAWFDDRHESLLAQELLVASFLADVHGMHCNVHDPRAGRMILTMPKRCNRKEAYENSKGLQYWRNCCWGMTAANTAILIALCPLEFC